MEDFIEIILFILLILTILFTGLLIFLFIKSPTIAYILILVFVLSLAAGVGVWTWKIYLKRRSENKRYRQQLSDNPEIASKMRDSKKRYYENIQAIQLSKNQYTQQIQQVCQLLQELNSQILALRYSQSNTAIGTEIAETIDELLTEIKTLEEIT